MSIHPRKVVIGCVFGSLALAFYLLWLWQPGRQLLLHQRQFLRAAEKRNWDKVAAFIDDGYHDRWELDKAAALRLSSEVLRQFFVLTILSEDMTGSVDSRSGTVFVRLRLDGEGTAIAHEAVRRVNELNRPFRFEWRHASWKPWDWRLTRVDQPELSISPDAYDYF